VPKFECLHIKENNTKKNSQLGFASWPLRRRTDEEIIRLCAYGIVQDPCQNQIKDKKT
jgi:hypothetical protein